MGAERKRQKPIYRNPKKACRLLLTTLLTTTLVFSTLLTSLQTQTVWATFPARAIPILSHLTMYGGCSQRNLLSDLGFFELGLSGIVPEPLHPGRLNIHLPQQGYEFTYVVELLSERLKERFLYREIKGLP